MSKNPSPDPDPDPGSTPRPGSGPGSGPRQSARSTLAIWRDVLLIVTLSVYGLHSGAQFLVPLALATLVFVLISAVSDRVRAWWPFATPLPVWLANLLGSGFILSGVFAVMYVLGSQATSFALAIPDYEIKLDSTVTRIAGLVGSEITNALMDMIINIDLAMVTRTAFGGARSFLSTFLLICLYVAFMMAERATLARKIQLTTGHRQLGRDLPGVMREISTSLQRYVGVKTFVSVLTAGFSYFVFLYLGLEFAETWAVLTFALNFIPAIGSIVAVLFPAAISLIQFETMMPFLVIIFGCGTVQFVVGNILDPALLSRSLNLSALMVILALTFWSAVWGITGAFISVPLTVCILIVLSHIPALRPMAILMSQDGTLLNDMINDQETEN